MDVDPYSAGAGRAICVWVTIAMVRPSLSLTVVCQTEVVRPMCSGMQMPAWTRRR